MTPFLFPAERLPAIRRRSAVAAGSLLLLAAVTALVLAAELRAPLKDDIAWLLYVARRWLAGRELYVDLVEVNPPLIVWISVIPLQLAEWLRVDAQFTAIPFFMGIVLCCAWWAASLLRRSGGLFAQRMPVFAVIGCVLLLIPGGEFGQREHLLAAAALPYLVLSAQSLAGIVPRVPTAVLAGVVAALGCALKPRYGLAFAGVECLAWAWGMRPWRRVLPLAGLATLLGYVGLVAAACPAYLGRAVPLALALYGVSDVSALGLAQDTWPMLLGVAAAGLLLISNAGTRAERMMMQVLAVFAAASTLVCFMDGKNWFYHQLPGTIASLLALLLWLAVAMRQGEWRARRRWAPLALASLATAVFATGAVRRLQPEIAFLVSPERTIVARLEQIIRREHAHSYIAFSEWIALGFPVVNQTGVQWASRFDSMWALRGELWRARFDAAASKEWPIRRWVAHDFITGCPDIATVDERGMDYVKVLEAASPAFARAWSHYRPIAAFDGLVVYRRSAVGCINPWVAAGGPVTKATN